MNERNVFVAALRQPSLADRAAYLDQACGTNAALREQVEALLREHEQLGSFLESPAAPHVSTLDSPVTERIGSVIGPYKLKEQIGEGGMGLVFVAEQLEPVRRKVALKLIKPGMDTRQVIARFEAERQALALMDHPNIAKIFDGGMTESSRHTPCAEADGTRSVPATFGRPYFVMELVRGVPITDYCDQNRLTPRARLELFGQVCAAVQHAHQKGIIHRDIKPSNVMVVSHDGAPVVKVIDFGVAKAIGEQLTDKSVYTQISQFIGTPLYMSPEQAGQSGLDIDTRTDVYALGVLLYELLTGTTPFDKERLQDAYDDEIRRLIREEEPPKPSTRLSTLNQQAGSTLSANRQSNPQQLRLLLRGDLDWIVMKALEKDRNRRYETASAFAADIQRYLHDEPVQACPPSFWYRFRKLVRRNKGAFVSVSAAALVVVLALVGLTVNNVMIRQEQKRTEDAKDRAEKAQKLAQERAAENQRELEGLKAANAWLDRGRWYLHERQWDDADAAFAKAVELRPDHVSVWVERGELHTRLGLWELAAADYAREIELREPDTTSRWYQHALLRYYVGDVDGYRQACRRMGERFRGTTKALFVEEVLWSSVLAPGPDADLPRLVELSQDFVVQHPWSSAALYILGTAHYRAGQYEQAIQRLREALTATDWSNRLLAYPVLAMAHHRQGQAVEARKALDEAAKVFDQWTQVRYQGRAEGDRAMRLGAEAVWPVWWWHWLEYQLYYCEAKVLIDGSPPADDPRLHVLRARAFAGLAWREKAVPEYDAALKLSPQDPQIRLEAHRNRGDCYVHRSQWGEAAEEYARACELGPEDSYLWRFRVVAHFAAGNVGAYRQACAAMLERFEKTEDPPTACNVLQVCVLREDALPDMARLLRLTRVADRNWHWGTWVRGAALFRADAYEESVRCFETAAKMFRRNAWEWCFLSMAHYRLGHADEARRCLIEAARWIDEANREGLDDLTGSRPNWSTWHNRVVYPLLFREAENLLKTEPGIRDQKSEKTRQPR